MRIRADKYTITLTGIILFFAIANLIWFRMDQAPPMWDQAQYLESSEVLYRTLTKSGGASFVAAFTDVLQIKAPLITILPIPLYLLFGNSYTSALWVNLLFIGICSYYLFKLGIIILGEKEALLSVFILNTFPLIFAMSREFLVEYGLMVFVIMWMYYVLKSDAFAHRKYAYPLGIVLGLGMLMKISFLLYIVFPTVFLCITKIVEQKKLSTSSVKNMIIVLLIGSLISGTWYFKNLPYIIRFAFASGYGEASKNWGMGEVFSLKTVLAYWTYIINYGISAYFFSLVILVGILSFLVRKNKAFLTNKGRAYFYFLIIWFTIPFIVFTFGINKDYRYTAPLWPAVAILMSSALVRVSEIKYGRILLLILLIFPMLNYWYVSFSPKGVFLRVGQWELLNNYLAYAHPPIRERWPNKELVTLIHKDSSKTNNARPRATLLFSHPYLNFINLNYYARNGNLDISFDALDYLSKETAEETVDRIEKSSDYILVKSDELGPDFATAKNVPVLSLLEKGKLNFKQIGEIPLPDETHLTIYRRDKRTYEIYSSLEGIRDYKINTKNAVNFSNKIRLLGHRITKEEGGYKISFFWECLNPIDRNYKIFVHVKDGDDRPLLSADHYPADGKYPTYNWRRGEIIREEIHIAKTLLPNSHIYVGIYEESTMSRLPVLNKPLDNPENIVGVRIY